MNKKVLGAVIALFVVVCGYLYATPYLVLNSIKKAAQAGDSAAVSKYIDYPSVRQSLKEQVNAQVVKKLATEDTNGWQALGAMMATKIVEQVVDAVVTPEGMTLMLKGKSLKDAEQNSQDDQMVEIQEEPKPEYEAGYTSMNDFEVVIKDQDQSREVKVLMVRDGLSWKIHKIAVPLN